MRRRPGAVLPLEQEILSAGVGYATSGNGEFHGYELARLLQDVSDARRLTGHGTLYKALSRMEQAGLLDSHWEDPQIAADEGRPRRRLYRVTGAGASTLSKLQAERAVRTRPEQGLAPT